MAGKRAARIRDLVDRVIEKVKALVAPPVLTPVAVPTRPRH